MTSLKLNLVSLDAQVYSCSNASRGFHKTCPLCDTRLCLCPLQQSTFFGIVPTQWHRFRDVWVRKDAHRHVQVLVDGTYQG